MEPVSRVTGRAVPLRRSDVDTDQIISSEWLKRVERSGFGQGLFEAWRSDPAFVLNRPEYSGAAVLLAGRNFGTGSSREHAVWALEDYGFKLLVSPRFADIFKSNCYKVGLLPVEVGDEVLETLMVGAETDPAMTITADLETCRLTAPVAGIDVGFSIDEYTRWRLREGLDDVGLTLRHQEQITAYEMRRQLILPIANPA
jgi:3-isopropylmalate/(R)-2-methylmalate dehydratase small subunit